MTGEENKGPEELIKLESVCRSYGYGDAESFALKNFSLNVKRGEFIMIMGPSGCGKTTLLNVLGLLDKPTTGAYFLNGQKVSSFSGRKKARLRARNIGFIFQDFNLIPNLTVIENVALPLVYSGATKTHRLIQASDTLSRFHLQEREYFFPSQLSGGQKQRVAIARSLVSKPEIILADEPTGNLDSRSSHIVMEELRKIHSEGNTIIMVTHNPNLTTYATRVIHMLDGGIDEDIKTVSDEDLPIPIHDRFERDEEAENEPEQMIFPGAKLEADTEKFEARKNLILTRDENPEELGQVLDKDGKVERKEVSAKEEPKVPVEEKPEIRPVETLVEEPKKATVSKAVKPVVKVVSKATTKTVTKPVKKKNAMPVVGLHSSGDPSVRIKEKPTIEELVSKEKK